MLQRGRFLPLGNVFFTKSEGGREWEVRESVRHIHPQRESCSFPDTNYYIFDLKIKIKMRIFCLAVGLSALGLFVFSGFSMSDFPRSDFLRSDFLRSASILSSDNKD